MAQRLIEAEGAERDGHEREERLSPGGAPIGYQLAHIDTGAIRDGRAVLKSKLELDPARAPAMQRYLIEAQISRFMDMAANLKRWGPVLRKIDELERQRTGPENEAMALKREAEAARVARNLTEEQIAGHLGDLRNGMKMNDRGRLEDCLGRMLSSIVLDPGSDELTFNCRIELPNRCLKVASPRGFEPRLPP